MSHLHLSAPTLSRQRSRSWRLGGAANLAATVLLVLQINAQSPSSASGTPLTPMENTTPAPVAKKSPRHLAHPAPAPEAVPVQEPAQPQPEQPQWPVNEAPGKPTITWDSHGLRINAANSSLHQILDQVSAATGAKVEGLGADERVFGEYGPGQARDVLSQLLNGSGYNVLMIGDRGEGTPRQIVLTARHGGKAPVTAGQPAQDEDTPDEDVPEPEQPESEEQPPPQPPMINGRPPLVPQGPPGAPRTPQQVLQELQQRQQQMQEQQQQQPQQQPQ